MELAVTNSREIDHLRIRVEDEDTKLMIHRDMPLRIPGIMKLSRRALSKGLVQTRNIPASSINR